jgi:hypothetical protein
MVRKKDHFTPQERSDEEAHRTPLEEFAFEKAGSGAFSKFFRGKRRFWNENQQSN